MTVSALIEDTPSGRAAKEISDFLYLDNKNHQAVFETIRKLHDDTYREAFGDGLHYYKKREDTND